MKFLNKEEDLEIFIKNHIEKIKQEKTKPEQLSILKSISKDGELDILEMISMSSPSKEEGRNSPFILRLLNNSPDGIAPEIIHEEIEREIYQLKKEECIESPSPEITSESMTSFLSSATDYLYGCTSYAMSSATKLIPDTLNKLEIYSIFSGITKTIIDQSFKGIVGGKYIADAAASVGSRVGYGLAGMVTGNSTNYLFGLDPKHLKLPTKILMKNLAKGNSLTNSAISTLTSAATNEILGVSNIEITDIIANGIMGYLKDGSIAGGIAGAAKRAIFLDIWKACDGKAHLNKRDFLNAAVERILAKDVSERLMISFPKETLAGVVALTTLMAINKYLESHKAVHKNSSILQETIEYLGKTVDTLTEVQAKIIQTIPTTVKEASNILINKALSVSVRGSRY